MQCVDVYATSTILFANTGATTMPCFGIGQITFRPDIRKYQFVTNIGHCSANPTGVWNRPLMRNGRPGLRKDDSARVDVLIH